jgi:molecular chaperone GrpE
LEGALEAGPRPPQSEDEATRTQLRTLVEVHDALALAAREAQRVRETILSNLDQAPPEQPKPLPAPPRRSFLAGLFGGGTESATVAALQQDLASERQRLAEARQGVGRIRAMLESLVTGYTMSLQRLERALRQHELEPIPCVDQPFDPERMEALEIVSGSGRPSGVVVDEVRRGYLWRDRVFRYAQVRVAKDS